jgi:hypothetical protein
MSRSLTMARLVYRVTLNNETLDRDVVANLASRIGRIFVACKPRII